MSQDPRPRPFEPEALARFVGAVRLAPRQAHKTLTLWPLVAETPRSASKPSAYVAASDAFGSGAFVGHEVAYAESIGEISVENRGEVPVLLMFGEELRGARQNRVPNASYLIAPRSRAVVAVSGVEHGRWALLNATFRPSGAVLSAVSRREIAASVAVSLGEGRGFVADQNALWRDVERRLRRSGTRSRTRAYAHHLETRASELEEATRAFRPVPGQVGFVASIGDAVAGLEIVARPDVFRRLFAGLIGSYLIDVLDGLGGAAFADGESPAPRPGQGEASEAFDGPEAFLRAVAEAPARASASLGLGEDVRLRGPGVLGCGLFADGLVQLSAFAEPGPRSHP